MAGCAGRSGEGHTSACVTPWSLLLFEPIEVRFEGLFRRGFGFMRILALSDL